MYNRKTIKLLLAVSLPLTFLTLYFGSLPAQSIEYISYSMMEYAIVPAFYFLLSISLSLIALYFLPERIFNSWKKFAVWYIPLAVLIFVLTADDTSSGWAVPSLTAPEDLAIIFSVLYAIVTVAIILGGLIKRGATTESGS